MKYFVKRIKRLVVPTWIFLIFLFIFNYFFRIQVWDKKTIISSFLLNNGIGYVWIVRIYLIIALIIPIISNSIAKYGSKKVYVGSAILYGIYELIAYYGAFNNGIVLYLFAYIIPCISLIVLSHAIVNSSNKRLIYMTIVSIVIFLMVFFRLYYINNRIVATQAYKYPFRFYYLSYAISVSLILLLILRNNKIEELLYNKVIEFISNNSFWIYLWHILFLQFNICDNFIVKYIFVFLSSVVVTFLQGKIIKILERKGGNKEIINIFKG